MLYVVSISWELFKFSIVLLVMEMGKKASLSEIQRAQVVILSREGLSEREISEKMSVGKTAVHQAIVKYRKSGVYSDQKRSGRSRKTTLRDETFHGFC